VFVEVPHDFGFVERFDLKTEVVDIPAGFRWSSSTVSTEYSVDGYEINHRDSSAKMNQTQFRAAPNDFALQNGAIEIDATLQILHSQNDVIYTLNSEGYH
jgi:hypothetical protein